MINTTNRQLESSKRGPRRVRLAVVVGSLTAVTGRMPEAKAQSGAIGPGELDADADGSIPYARPLCMRSSRRVLAVERDSEPGSRSVLLLLRVPRGKEITRFPEGHFAERDGDWSDTRLAGYEDLQDTTVHELQRLGFPNETMGHVVRVNVESRNRIRGVTGRGDRPLVPYTTRWKRHPAVAKQTFRWVSRMAMAASRLKTTVEGCRQG